jgi:hypothetical protein
MTALKSTQRDRMSARATQDFWEGIAHLVARRGQDAQAIDYMQKAHSDISKEEAARVVAFYLVSVGDQDLKKNDKVAVLTAIQFYRRAEALNEPRGASKLAQERIPAALPYRLIVPTLSWSRACRLATGLKIEKEPSVKAACEAAVEQNRKSVAARDSRGMNYALNGNYSGAVDDFRFVTAHAHISKVKKQQREKWIDALRQKGNPFGDEMRLEALGASGRVPAAQQSVAHSAL